MDWTPGGLSEDVEDRRGSSGGGGFGGGGGIGIIGFIILLVISLITGRNYIGSYLAGGGAVASHPSTANQPYDDRTAVARRDRSAPNSSPGRSTTCRKPGRRSFPSRPGIPTVAPNSSSYDDYTYSGCGTAQSQTGPFYCPADEKVYIDLSFWNELKRLGGSNAEFAQAYVVAHELGHHVQNILGIEQQVRHLSGQDPIAEKPSLRRSRIAGRLLRGYLGAQHRAAQHRSRCRYRRRSSGRLGCRRRPSAAHGARIVSPESFTHGSSAQRVGWFNQGLQQGTVAACNTFKTGGAVPFLIDGNNIDAQSGGAANSAPAESLHFTSLRRKVAANLLRSRSIHDCSQRIGRSLLDPTHAAEVFKQASAASSAPPPVSTAAHYHDHASPAACDGRSTAKR